jgi:plasmid stabilization system protein ParE
MSRYRLLPEATDDLEEIRQYIAADNPDAADRVVDEILDAIAALVPMPNIGHYRWDLTSLPIRFWTVRRYLVAYASAESPLLMLAILHGNRDPRTLAAILADRLP